METADLCRVWIPRAYGGLEGDLHAGLDSMFEIGRACASSSWCLSVWQQHSWIVALFPEAAQRETLAADPDFHIAAVLAPRGTAEQVDGGFRLNGFWPFASGCEHGGWILLGALVTDNGGAEIPLGRELSGLPAQNARLCLLPIDDVTILGDWGRRRPRRHGAAIRSRSTMSSSGPPHVADTRRRRGRGAGIGRA